MWRKYVDDGECSASRFPFARMLLDLEEDIKVKQNWWKIVIISHDLGKQQDKRATMKVNEDTTELMNLLKL